MDVIILAPGDVGSLSYYFHSCFSCITDKAPFSCMNVKFAQKRSNIHVYIFIWIALAGVVYLYMYISIRIYKDS